MLMLFRKFATFLAFTNMSATLFRKHASFARFAYFALGLFCMAPSTALLR